MTEFRRDRITWVGYVMLAWSCYLQVAPGQVIVYLRDELDLSYAMSGLHVTAFAAGCVIAGLLSARIETAFGRNMLMWAAAALMGVGTIGLTAAGNSSLTVGSTLIMGMGGGAVLATIQAALADRHGGQRTIALAEANVAASIGYLALIGALSLTALLQVGWRAALLVSLAVPLLIWWYNRPLRVQAPPSSVGTHGRLPGVFWIAASLLFCTTAAEWCVTAWGATFLREAVELPADTAVTLMAGYFGGVLVGRIIGSRLARRFDPARLLALALAVAVAGFAILWTSTAPAPALFGLALLGIGLGNLFPMAVSLAVALAPEHAALASGRTVAMSSFAVVLAPFTVGTLADATSIKIALGVVPIMIVLAAAALAVLKSRRFRPTSPV